jgi:hypothetical protein
MLLASTTRLLLVPVTAPEPHRYIETLPLGISQKDIGNVGRLKALQFGAQPICSCRQDHEV